MRARETEREKESGKKAESERGREKGGGEVGESTASAQS